MTLQQWRLGGYHCWYQLITKNHSWPVPTILESKANGPKRYKADNSCLLQVCMILDSTSSTLLAMRGHDLACPRACCFHCAVERDQCNGDFSFAAIPCLYDPGDWNLTRTLKLFRALLDINPVTKHVKYVLRSLLNFHLPFRVCTHATVASWPTPMIN